MRWAQLTLAENDPAQYDVNFWLDYFKRGARRRRLPQRRGLRRLLPDQDPAALPQPWLGDRDPFGELYEGCRRLGMNVIARTDPHAVHQDVYDAHPDWIMVGADGQPLRHWADPELWVTCALGPYNFEYMTEVTREIMSLYPVDGIFSNRWAGHGICYCEHCQRNFRDASGHDLPAGDDRRGPARKAVLGWRQERLFELWDVWDGAIREVLPHARFIPNSGGAHG